MRGIGLFQAIEFDDHDTLEQPGLIGFDRVPASQKSPSGRRDRWTGELGITGQRDRVRNRTINRHPIRLSHRHLHSDRMRMRMRMRAYPASSPLPKLSLSAPVFVSVVAPLSLAGLGRRPCGIRRRLTHMFDTVVRRLSTEAGE